MFNARTFGLSVGNEVIAAIAKALPLLFFRGRREPGGSSCPI